MRVAYDIEIAGALDTSKACGTLALGDGTVTLSALPADAVAALDEKQQTLVASAQAVFTSVVGGGTLLNAQREAYYVVNADEKLWANRYNRAYGRGYGGGTDVVIKLNDTADFTVKGLVFDARSTAEMVKKVGVSAIGLIASAYGAPVSITAGSNGAGTMTFSQTDKIGAADVSLAVGKKRDQAYRESLSRLADDILAEMPALKADATKDAAAARVMTVFTATKAVITATAGAPAPAPKPATP